MRLPEAIPETLDCIRYTLAPSRNGMDAEAVATEFYAKVDCLIYIMQAAGEIAKNKEPKTKRFSTSPPNKVCSQCGKKAHLVCSDCVDGRLPDSTLTPLTYYCNKACQKAHRESHRPFCDTVNRTKAVYQAGELLYDAFVWCKVFSNACQGNRQWSNREATRRVLGKPLDFNMFGGSDIESGRDAAMDVFPSEDIVNFLQEFVQKMLKDYCTEMEEVCITVDKTNHKAIKYLQKDDDEVVAQEEHWVLKVFVEGERDGHSVLLAIDLNGEQYSQKTPVMPWKTYEQVMPGTIKDSNRSGVMRRNFEVTFQKLAPESDGEAVDLEVCKCAVCCEFEEKHYVKHYDFDAFKEHGMLWESGTYDELVLDVKIRMAQALAGLTWRNEQNQSIGEVVGEGKRKFKKEKRAIIDHIKGVLGLVAKKSKAAQPDAQC